MNATPTAPTPTAQVERKTRKPRSSSSSTSTAAAAPTLATGVPFLDHMLDQVARHGMIDLDGRRQGRPAHRCASHRRGHRHHARAGVGEGARRQEGHTPLRSRLRSARRGAVARRDRPVRAAGARVPRADFARAMIGDFDVDLVHEFFQGFVNHALVTLHVDNLRGDNAHHQAETVFKAFARALRMAVDARSACRRPAVPVDQGHASCHSEGCPGSCMARYRCRRLRHGQPALGGEGARARRAGPARSSCRATRRRSAPPSASCFPGQGAMPDCMRGLERERPAPSRSSRRRATSPFLGICLGLQMLFDSSEEGPTPGLGVLPGRVRALPRRNA